MAVHMCNILLITPKVISGNLEQGSNGWPFLIMSSIQRSRPHPSPLAKMRRMACGRLIFSRRSCATGLKWLGCADHPFFLSFALSGILQPISVAGGKPCLVFPAKRQRFQSCKDTFLSNHLSHWQLLTSNILCFACYFYIFFLFPVSFIWGNFAQKKQIFDL